MVQAAQHGHLPNAEASWQPVPAPALRNPVAGGFQEARAEGGVRPASVVVRGQSLMIALR